MKRFWKDGDIVLFQGDSITDCGRDREDDKSLGTGYASKLAGVYDNLFPGHKVNFINRGVSGDRTCDLVRRYNKDFKEVQPDFISILIGINDVWRKYDSNDPTSIGQFEQNYRTVLEAIKREIPKARIMILEPFLVHTMEERTAWRVDLDPVIGVTRKLAHEYADYYLPLDGILNCYRNKGYSDAQLAEDCVHPSPQGHGIIAYEYMKLLEII